VQPTVQHTTFSDINQGTSQQPGSKSFYTDVYLNACQSRYDMWREVQASTLAICLYEEMSSLHQPITRLLETFSPRSREEKRIGRFGQYFKTECAHMPTNKAWGVESEIWSVGWKRGVRLSLGNRHRDYADDPVRPRYTTVAETKSSVCRRYLLFPSYRLDRGWLHICRQDSQELCFWWLRIS